MVFADDDTKAGMERPFALVAHYTKGHRKLLAANAVVLLASALSESVGMSMLVPILDSIDSGESQSIFGRMSRTIFSTIGIAYTFTNLVLVFGAVMLTKYSLVAFQQHIARVLEANVTADLMGRGFKNLMELPIAFYYKVKLGDLVATEFTSARAVGGLLHSLLQMSKGMLFALAYLTIGFLLSVRLTLVLCVVGAVCYVAIARRFRLGLSQGTEEKQITDDTHSFLFDSLGGIRVIKAHNSESAHRKALDAHIESLRRVVIKIMDNKIFTSLLFEPLVFAMLLVLTVLAVQVLQLPTTSLLVLLFVFVQLSPQVKLANNHYLQVKVLSPHLAKIHDLITRKGKVYLPKGTREIREFRQGIRIYDVSFSYPGRSVSVLRNVNVEVQKNQTVAVVGHSGAGKSTLVDLLLRHHDPTEGRILVDETDLREIDLDQWRRLVGVVDQDPYLFNRSIEQNLLEGNPSATAEEIVQATQLANAHDFIQELPSGYETVIGTRGLMLSGGQRQRIALARALVRNPVILILDEATSALDSESEAQIQESIQRLRSSKTFIIIAHRLSTIRNADKIILLEDGEIMEQGNHDELIRKGGRYKDFYAGQLEGAEAEVTG